MCMFKGICPRGYVQGIMFKGISPLSMSKLICPSVYVQGDISKGVRPKE